MGQILNKYQKEKVHLQDAFLNLDVEMKRKRFNMLTEYQKAKLNIPILGTNVMDVKMF